jgi:hypothetical protein
MVSEKSVVSVGKIENRILLVRGDKVIIDVDLAEFTLLSITPQLTLFSGRFRPDNILCQ